MNETRNPVEEGAKIVAAIEAQERVYPTYEVMIKNLFKPMARPIDCLMHAAIGVAGEAAEMLSAHSRKNVLEEGGDLEFYIEALKQSYTVDMSNGVIVDPRGKNITVGNVYHNVVTLGGDILDLVKKSWVYGRDVNAKEITNMVILLEVNLQKLYEFAGFERSFVQYTNMVKLIGPGGRFESGFYSDADALARKDKVGEDRKFMGQNKLSNPDGSLNLGGAATQLPVA